MDLTPWKAPFCFAFTRMSPDPSPPWRPKYHPGSDSLVKGCRWPPSKHHCILSFIHCAAMMKELVRKENLRACQNPGERAEQSGKATGFWTVFVRKGTFKRLVLQDISFFNVTNSQALPFQGLGSAESTLLQSRLKTISKKKKWKKAKWLSEEALQISEKRREVKGKGEKEVKVKCESRSVMSDSLQNHGLSMEFSRPEYCSG